MPEAVTFMLRPQSSLPRPLPLFPGHRCLKADVREFHCANCSGRASAKPELDHPNGAEINSCRVLLPYDSASQAC